MSTRYDKKERNNHSIDAGYEGNNVTYNYTIPSCGLEDVDKAVFKLFDEQIPLYYNFHGEVKRVPVIFATGERFAILRRNKPITDRKGALILPLISITRNSIENVPSKGVANNQIFPHVITKRISEKDLYYRQLKNIEGLENTQYESDSIEKDFNLSHKTNNNLIETIEIPPIKYFGVSYDITIWSSFTSQMNKLIEAIMSSYTHNPGSQFKIESDSGYWFTAYIDQNFNQDTSYAEFTDNERFIKTTLTLNTAGYLVLPNIEGGKVGLRSFVNSPTVSFEVQTYPNDLDPNLNGIQDSNPEAMILDDLRTEDDYIPSSGVGINSKENAESLKEYNKSSASASNNSSHSDKYDRVGEYNSTYTRNKKINIRKEDGSIIEVMTKQGAKGETIYDQKMAEILFNISIDK